MSFVTQVGVKPALGGVFNVSITTSQALTVPTALQRARNGTILWAVVSIEGDQVFRVRWDGTAPTAAIGIAYPAPTATTPQILTIIGDVMIAAFRVIAAAAGDTMSYAFFQNDARP